MISVKPLLQIHIHVYSYTLKDLRVAKKLKLSFMEEIEYLKASNDIFAVHTTNDSVFY